MKGFKVTSDVQMSTTDGSINLRYYKIDHVSGYKGCNLSRQHVWKKVHVEKPKQLDEFADVYVKKNK